MSDATITPPMPRTYYATLQLAAERALLYLEGWKQSKPWRDSLDACFAVANESPNWGLEPAWSELLREVRAQVKHTPALRDPRFQGDSTWRP
jgi:hypothetical protein